MYKDKPKPPLIFIIFQIVFMFAIGLFLFFGFQASAVFNPVVMYVFFCILFVMLLVNIHAALNTRYIIKNKYVVAKAGFLITIYSKVDFIESVSRVNSASRLLGWNFGGVQGVANRFQNLIFIKAGKKNFYISPTDCNEFIKAIESQAGRNFE